MIEKKMSHVQAKFEVARSMDKVDHYTKSKRVQIRPALNGEETTKIVNGEEVHKSATNEDYIVKTDKEEYIITSATFQLRYALVEDSSSSGDLHETKDKDEYKEYDAIGDCYAFQHNGEEFSFPAIWDEVIIVHDGDFIVSVDEYDLEDIYHIEKDKFIKIYKKED